MSIHKLVTRSWWAFISITALAVAMAVGLPAMNAQGADHLDGPTGSLGTGIADLGLSTPQGKDPRVDINDLYAFGNGDDLVLIMTVGPLAGSGIPGTGPAEFHPKGKYEFLIDNDGDAKKDKSIKIDFSKPDKDGEQKIKVRGPDGIKGKGKTGEDIELKNGGRVRAGLFDDPFFFDLLAFRGDGGRTFCDGAESDTFELLGANVMAIVIEMPSDVLGSEFDVWARTKLGGRVDRMGPPLTNTLNPNDIKDAFNRGKPDKDLKDFDISPDVLGYPTPGRALATDVFPGGLGEGDCVDAHSTAFLSAFPYLVPAN